MEFFTALLFSYAIKGEPMDAVLWFDTEARCEKASRAADELYETIFLLYEDTMVRCVRSNIASTYTIRPKARPDNLMEKYK